MAAPRFRITERQVLLTFLAISVIVFGGAFLVGGFRQRGEPVERVDQARVRWMPPREAAPAASPYVVAEYFDPSLLSLPSEHGFSQKMWRRSATAPTRVFEPAAELALLDPPVSSDELSPLLTQARLPDAVQGAVKKLPAPVEEIVARESSIVAIAATQTVMQVEGALENRSLLREPDLPMAADNAGLRPTRVRIAVGMDGFVRYAVLDRSCGNDTMDAQAVTVARRLRFEPASSPDPLALSWGILRFHWAARS